MVYLTGFHLAAKSVVQSEFLLASMKDGKSVEVRVLLLVVHWVVE